MIIKHCKFLMELVAKPAELEKVGKTGVTGILCSSFTYGCVLLPPPDNSLIELLRSEASDMQHKT